MTCSIHLTSLIQLDSNNKNLDNKLHLTYFLPNMTEEVNSPVEKSSILEDTKPVATIAPNKSKSILIIIIIVLAVLLSFVSAFLLFTLLDKDDTPEGEETTIEETTQKEETPSTTTTVVDNADTGPKDCVATKFDDNTYPHGDSYTTLDGCETCECDNGSWNCTVDITCTMSATDCLYEGTVYNTGDTFQASDGCNSCTCVNGGVSCTLMMCP